MNNQGRFKALVENAFDFLNRALLEFENDPKYSVIHFYAAVELFLKARLMAEHWTLVIAARKEPDVRQFENGDFQSVSFEDAVSRLDKVVGQPLALPVWKQFDSLRRHRNKMVHFFHSDATADAKSQRLSYIAGEQLQAWYFLNRLLETEWGAVFKGWEKEILAVGERLRGHNKYLELHYEQLRPKIESLMKRGVVIEECPTCGYHADRVEPILGDLLQSDCMVCGFEGRSISVECPDCSKPILFVSEGFATCECLRRFEPEQLAAILDTDHSSPDDALDAMTPAHCVSCESYRTVAEYKGRYFCASCFAIYDDADIEQCQCCGDYNTGPMGESFLDGCVACEGRWGDLRDE